MKVFICLLATITACNATFFSGLGGGKTVTYNVVAKPSVGYGQGGYFGHGHVESYGHGHGHSHGHSHGYSHVESYGHSHGHGHDNGHSFEIAPQVIKVILEESRGHGGGADIHSYGSSYGASYATAPQEAIYQVIHESAPISHGYSGGGHAEYAVLDAGHAYASDYSHNLHSSHGSGGGSIQLNSILPQILQIIGQDGAFGGGGGSSAHYGQLIDAFGHHGTAFVTPSKKGQNAYFNSGHVIEKGVLELSQGKHSAGGGGAFGGSGLGDLLGKLSSGKGAIGGQGGSGLSSIKSGW